MSDCNPVQYGQVVKTPIRSLNVNPLIETRSLEVNVKTGQLQSLSVVRIAQNIVAEVDEEGEWHLFGEKSLIISVTRWIDIDKEVSVSLSRFE